MINKEDLLKALERDYAPYTEVKGVPFPQDNDYAYLDESGDGDPVWTFNRDRMEEDAYTLLKANENMSYDKFKEREREVLYHIEEILNCIASRCSDKKIIGDIGFYVGGAYRTCANFLTDIRNQVFPKNENKG